MKTRFWKTLKNLLKNESGNVSTTLASLANRFQFSYDVERADSRISDNKIYLASATRPSSETQYSAISSSDFRNPFADYLADDAKVWSMYLDLTKAKGEELMKMWNSDLDTILIFAGLFSAILTAFLIETRKKLQEDSQDVTNEFLKQLVVILSSNPQLETPLPPLTKFVPSSPLVWVNGLWFVSLTFSLTGAFGTILAKGWVSQFIPVSAGLPIIDACNRHRRFFGDDQRHLRAVIVALPITLHIAFYLFFGGLVILLFEDDPRIGIVVTTLIGITMLLYLGCSMRPVLNPNSPFRTPISGLLPIIPGLLLPLILLGDVVGHLTFSSRKRRYKQKKVRCTYTGAERLFMSITKLRRVWINGIMDTITALYHLMLVSNPPSDELRTDVLVGLFSLARTHKLDDPVCALAGLPMTSRLQEALYATDPVPALTRNIAELFASLSKTENSDIACAYLTVLLSLVQTTHSSLNWSATSLVPLLQPGGILSNWDIFKDDVLELVICIHIHVRVRSGFLVPAQFPSRIPAVMANCTNPLHRQLLINACFVLSAMDSGRTLESLALNERMHPILLGPDLGITLSSMIKHPQKRVQRAALSSICQIGSHVSGCVALVHQDIIKLLLEHIPGSDPQFQCEALLNFEVFLRFGEQSEAGKEQDPISYDQAMLEPWIESIFSLFLAAMMKSDNMNVQEAAVKVLSKFLRHDYPRAQFNHLNHTSALLNMFETGENSLKMSSMQVLSVILSFEDSRPPHILNELPRSIGFVMVQNTSHAGIHRHILDFVHQCLIYDDLKWALFPYIMEPLIEIFKFGKSMSEFTDKLFLFLYDVSCDGSINDCLFNADVILFQLNTISNTDVFNPWSLDIIYKSLINILEKAHSKRPKKQEKGKAIAKKKGQKAEAEAKAEFLPFLKDDIKNSLVPTDLMHTITHLLGKPEPSLQILAMDLLKHCSRFLDLLQDLGDLGVISHLIQRLDLGDVSVKGAALKVLLKLMSHRYMKSLIVQSPNIIDSLLTIIWRNWDKLSGLSFDLLKECIDHSEDPALSLSDSTPVILTQLLSTKKPDEIMAALYIISRCAKCCGKKNYGTIMKFFSTEIFMAVIEVLDSTSELKVQEKVIDTLGNVIGHDQLRPMIAIESLVHSLLYASMSSDEYGPHALGVLGQLLRSDLAIPPVSKPEYMDILLGNLASRNRDRVLAVIDIAIKLAATEHGRDAIVKSGFLKKFMDVGTSTDNSSVCKSVVVGIRHFLEYGELRQDFDVALLMKFILHAKGTRWLHSELLYSFVVIMQHRDIHSKVIHPKTIETLYHTIFQSTNPLTVRLNLRAGERHYLLQILETIKEADGDALRLVVEELFPPTTPFENQIAFEHAFLGFPDDIQSDSEVEAVFDDAESVIVQLDIDTTATTI